jgi:branched-chain amino acid transport system permease protein
MRRDIGIGLVLFAVIALLPILGGAYSLRLTTTALMYIVLAISWNFIGGMAGYPSFASAAFFGLGAYTGGVLQAAGAPVLLAWCAAGVVAVVFAGVLGWVLLRLRGHYFAIASFALVEVVRVAVNSATDLTGGGMGLNLPLLKIGSIEAQAMFFFYAMLALAAVTFATSLIVTYSRLGFGLRCIEQNEPAADILGINTTLHKVSAFMLSAVFVGMAGAIYASWVHYIEPPDVFDIMYSVKSIVMVLLGGTGSIFGPIVGAALYLSLEEVVWRNLLQLNTGALGILIVLLVLYLPRGILSLRTYRFARRPA